MKEKALPGPEPHEFHWTMEGIRREAEIPAPPRSPHLHVAAEDDAVGDSENRRYPRIDLTLPILYKILPDAPLVASQAALPTVPTKVDNISPTGACLVLAEKLPKGTNLALSFHVEKKGPISAVGRVVWAKPTETAHHFLTGLEFVVVYRKTHTKTEYLNTSVLKDLLDPS
ncbi:MAG: PilZ domain-containing protein [Elusimicrobia bacterium]|nr:PilZ domain-containing protein [Elusimicrobiota bacterium]